MRTGLLFLALLLICPPVVVAGIVVSPEKTALVVVGSDITIPVTILFHEMSHHFGYLTWISSIVVLEIVNVSSPIIGVILVRSVRSCLSRECSPPVVICTLICMVVSVDLPFSRRRFGFCLKKLFLLCPDVS